MTVVYSENWNTALGGDSTSNATRDTTTTHEGAGSCKLTLSASSGYWIKNSSGSPTVVVWQVWVRFSSLPTSNCEITSVYPSGGGGTLGLGYKSADQKFVVNVGGYMGNPSEGPTINTGQWYKIDCRADVSANPHKIDCSVDGTAFTQRTNAVAAATLPDYRLGTYDSSTSYTAFYDDLQASHTFADYPIGGVTLDNCLPDADVTTTGWSTAPLFSKINDASDATVITATAA
jgi:hypothetical protein